MKVNLEVLSFGVSSWASIPLLLSASRKFSRLQGGAKVSERVPLGLCSQPSLFDTTCWFSISKATATSWMPYPHPPLPLTWKASPTLNLERAMASTDLSNNSGILMLYCSRWVRVPSSKEGRLWSWDCRGARAPQRKGGLHHARSGIFS